MLLPQQHFITGQARTRDLHRGTGKPDAFTGSYSKPSTIPLPEQLIEPITQKRKATSPLVQDIKGARIAKPRPVVRKEMPPSVNTEPASWQLVTNKVSRNHRSCITETNRMGKVNRIQMNLFLFPPECMSTAGN